MLLQPIADELSTVEGLTFSSALRICLSLSGLSLKGSFSAPNKFICTERAVASRGEVGGGGAKDEEQAANQSFPAAKNACYLPIRQARFLDLGDPESAIGIGELIPVLLELSDDWV